MSIHGRLFLTPAGITIPLALGSFTPIALMRTSTSGATSMMTTSAVLLLTASLTATRTYTAAKHAQACNVFLDISSMLFGTPRGLPYLHASHPGAAQPSGRRYM